MIVCWFPVGLYYLVIGVNKFCDKYKNANFHSARAVTSCQHTSLAKSCASCFIFKTHLQHN